MAMEPDYRMFSGWKNIRRGPCNCWDSLDPSCLNNLLLLHKGHDKLRLPPAKILHETWHISTPVDWCASYLLSLQGVSWATIDIGEMAISHGQYCWFSVMATDNDWIGKVSWMWKIHHDAQVRTQDEVFSNSIIWLQMQCNGIQCSCICIFRASVGLKYL